MLMRCHHCGKRHVPSPHHAVVCHCGERIARPAAPWPRWAKLIAKRRKPEDIGVGSTVRRIAERRGGERFKRIAEWLGIPCGCTTREERWNRLYPYNKQSGFTEAKE